ncbi:hypothetical protein PR202_ga13068 [Eleusine coracana subsp. coracana]|uniref:PB1 domain-containing protein n=1 Tax=Eleusine coracana subsp. coracana TaxID=191504 RepID=A0AAV5CDX8_ELECO|nr:hypothetical protein PR202_ga13068 [Eleusine coracana subsp. coracana]
MAAESSPRVVGDSADAADARMKMKMKFSHGGRFVFSGPDASPRTRVLAVPRSASFRDLAARASEMAGGAEVRALRHRLADDEEIIVSVTCDDELAHMVHEYDRLRAKRPNAAFRVFVATTTTTSPSSGVPGLRRHHHQHLRAAAHGLPPLAPRTMMRRVQSDHALATTTSAQRFNRRPANPAPMRRVQSAQEIAMKASRAQPSQSFHHQNQCRFVCLCPRQDSRAPAPAPPPACAPPHISRRNDVTGVPVEAETPTSPPWTPLRTDRRSGSSSEGSLALCFFLPPLTFPVLMPRRETCKCCLVQD